MSTNQNLEVVPAQSTQFNEVEIVKRLKALKKAKRGMNLVSDYYEFTDKGQTSRGVFLGFDSFEKIDQNTGSIKELDTINWIDEGFNMCSNAGTQLVQAFRNVLPGTPIEIEYIGTKKVQTGSMKKYKVTKLIIEETK